jgi:hypothetical protein
VGGKTLLGFPSNIMMVMWFKEPFVGSLWCLISVGYLNCQQDMYLFSSEERCVQLQCCVARASFRAQACGHISTARPRKFGLHGHAHTSAAEKG